MKVNYYHRFPYTQIFENLSLIKLIAQFFVVYAWYASMHVMYCTLPTFLSDLL